MSPIPEDALFPDLLCSRRMALMRLRTHVGIWVCLAGTASGGVWAQTGASSLALSPALPPTDPNAYRLATGDVISVRVFGEDDLTRERLRISSTGMIALPTIGEIQAQGLLVGELADQVTRRLKGRILVNPRVTVNVEEYRPFFINGMVERPGGYPYLPGLTVRKAAALAGGFKERASMSKIFLIREGDPGGRAQKVDLSTPVGPGDQITVEESFF